jgi:hypothetical protein
MTPISCWLRFSITFYIFLGKFFRYVISGFRLLNYDLAKEKGIALSLLQSHISQFNKDASPHSIWCEILAEVQNFKFFSRIIREKISTLYSSYKFRCIGCMAGVL